MGGSKGKKPTMVADNLFNQDMVELVFGIGEGTIRGLTNGLKTMYVAGIPIESESGELNFQDLGISIKQGYYDDQPVRFLMGGEASIINSANSVSLPADITRTFNTPSNLQGKISYIDIRLFVQALYSGTSGGDVYASSVLLEIKYRKVGSTSWNYVTGGTDELVAQRKKVETLKQEAVNRGVDFDSLSESQRKDFELEVLRSMGNITSEDIAAYNKLVALDQRVEKITSETSLLFSTKDQPVNLIKQVPQVQENSNWKDYSKQVSGLTKEQLNNELLVIEGKTTSGYIKEICIPIFDSKDDDHNWEIQITRKSKGLTSDERKFSGKEISIESIALITEQERSYSKVATCQIVAQHTDRFNQIPDFSGEFDGFLCEVPWNYNPDTKEWSGVWDGRFKRAWTNNNALILRELLMNRDWGKRSVEPMVLMDNTSLFEAIKWCDEPVEDINGDMVPRYTFNMVVQEQQSLDEFIKLVAGTFHASIREIQGVNYLFIDRPQEPRFFVSSETILQTGFHFSLADLESQYNEIKVSFPNAENNYQEDRRRVIDEQSIIKNGYIPYSFNAIGVTNITEALRQAAYLLYTNRDESLFVTFSQPRLGHLVQLYDHFLLACPKNGWGFSGRILNYEPDKGLIHLRDPVLTLTGSDSYYFRYHLPNGLKKLEVTTVDPLTLKITDTSEWNQSGYLIDEAPFVLSGGTYGEPKTFRVLEMSQSDSNDVAQGELYQFKANVVSLEKYTKLDNIGDQNLDLNLEKEVITYKREETPTKPKNVRLYVLDHTNEAGQMLYKLTFDVDVVAPEYEVVWTNEHTGESRRMYIQDTEAVISPAFNYSASIRLKITPINYKGDRMQSADMIKVKPKSEMVSKLPSLLNASYSESTESVTFNWSNDPSDIFAYSYILVDYKTPVGVKSDIRIDKSVRSYTIPFSGFGDYTLTIRYIITGSDGLGYAGEVGSQLWTFTLDDEVTVTYLSAPWVTEIRMLSTMRKEGGSTTGVFAAPEGYGFLGKLNILLPDRGEDYTYGVNKQPFELQYCPDSNLNTASWSTLTYYGSSPTLKASVVILDGADFTTIKYNTQNTYQQTFKLGGYFRVRACYLPNGMPSEKDSDWLVFQIPLATSGGGIFNPTQVYNQNAN